MLERLTIRNLAVIDQAEIGFETGLNILSGETGAGKSIVLEAISLLLGSRASSELVRFGCDEAVVEGAFDTSALEWVRERLRAAQLPESGDPERSVLLIKRTVHRAGKHRIAVNGESTTLGALQTLCEGLIDLCSQHEHQSLLKSSVQVELLDQYGGTTPQRREFTAAFESWRDTVAEARAVEKNVGERERQRDFLQFQIQELREADLKPGEETSLQARKQLLQSASQRAQAVQGAISALEREDGGATQELRVALQRLRPLLPLDAALESPIAALERALAELDDGSMALHRYSDGIELDPTELESVMDRLARLVELRRKYGADSEAMLTTLQELESQWAQLEGSESRLAELQARCTELRHALLKMGQSLSQRRTRAASLLATSVTAELRELNMAEAEFQVTVERAAPASGADAPAFQASGLDAVMFQVRTNRGDSARPLGKVASGGELSRLMLAIRRVISDRGGIGVYLFDEIDTGMGGQTAFQVGKKLKSVAAGNQVICITHLPQVAAFADHHLVVRKATRGKTTVTEITELKAPQRREELARMLGGSELTKKSLANAAELMAQARV